MALVPRETTGRFDDGGRFERRRRGESAARLRRAALQLFSERGFDAVTIEDIALAAGLPARSFFAHFAGKADVLLSLGSEEGDFDQRSSTWMHRLAG